MDGASHRKPVARSEPGKRSPLWLTLGKSAERARHEGPDLTGPRECDHRLQSALKREADAQIRTGDPFITSEVLYQLSYVGEAPTLAGCELESPAR